MGAGASAANEIDEYESKGFILEENEKTFIRSYSFEGKTSRDLKHEFESLKLDTTLSPEMRQFLEYQIEKIAIEVANEAIQCAAQIHQDNERNKAIKLNNQNPPSLYQLSKLHSKANNSKNDDDINCSSKYHENKYNEEDNDNNNKSYNKK